LIGCFSFSRLFIHPEPYAVPHSALSAFVRFLDLLYRWDWDAQPMVVRLLAPDMDELLGVRNVDENGVDKIEEGLTNAATRANRADAANLVAESKLMHAIGQRFEAARAAGTAPPMYVVAIVHAPQVVLAQMQSGSKATGPKYDTGGLVAIGGGDVAQAGFGSSSEPAEESAGGMHEPIWTADKPELVVLRKMSFAAGHSVEHLRRWLGAWLGSCTQGTSVAKPNAKKAATPTDRMWHMAFYPQIDADVTLELDRQVCCALTCRFDVRPTHSLHDLTVAAIAAHQSGRTVNSRDQT
jgi:hypothetical protein